MNKYKVLVIVTAILALALGAGWAVKTTAIAVPVYMCLPTCEEDDGRMITIAGSGLATFVGAEVHFQIAAPADATSVELGIFDGNTTGMWDEGVASSLDFHLYADPAADGSVLVALEVWPGNSLPDNAWFTHIRPVDASAKSKAGGYFYHLLVHMHDPVVGSFFSNFKVRTDGYLVSITPFAFEYMAAVHTMEDLYIIYPEFDFDNYPASLTPTTYDGYFNFFLYLESSMSTMLIADGDLDYGAWNLLTMDSDDPDTSNTEIPVWAAGTEAQFEGVALGDGGSSGSPSDDFSEPLTSRIPSVVYKVIDPFGRQFLNLNPSGNSEWEYFRITSVVTMTADHHVDDLLPSGLYEISLEGMDMHNLNAWRFFHDVVGVCPELIATPPQPCKPVVMPYLIGDTVFEDLNGNGVQDPGEPGIPGVLVNLLDINGRPVNDLFDNPITTVTDANGNYTFNVQGLTEDPYHPGSLLLDGVYTVLVDPSNFLAGGVLAGMTATTPSPTQTNTVTDENVMTYDFGYKNPPPGTGTIGFWKTHPEAWPVTSITIGGRTYTREQAIEWMKKATSTDKTISLFAQLVAAKLNVLVGNEASCISSDIAAADAWMALHPVGSKVSANSPAWKEIENSYNMLDKYNNGLLCAPHRD